MPSPSSGPSLVNVIVNATFWPAAGVALSTSLVNSRSEAGGTFSVALSWSSSLGTSLPGVESGSYWSAVSTCAMLSMMPEFVTVAVICRLVLPPTARLPMSQTPVPLS
jgi:hypothetical protein